MYHRTCIYPYRAEFTLTTITQTDLKRLLTLDGSLVNSDSFYPSEECRARSDCMYVQSDLALHSSRNKSMIAKSR